MEHIHRFRLIPLTAVLALATTYCWAQPVHTGKQKTTISETADEGAPPDGNLFYEVLLGEITTRTGDPGAGYALMLDAARRSHSSQLYQRAADIALQSRSGDYALAAAKAWQEDQLQSQDANRYVLQILIALNRVSDTTAPLQQFIQHAPVPNKIGILNAIPQMYGRVSDKAAAVKAVQDALKTELTSQATGAAAWITLGRMHLGAGDQNGALESLAKAQVFDPTYEGLARLALELLDEGSNEAKFFITQFLQQQSAPEIRMLFSRVLLAQSKFAEASDQLNRVTKDKPDMAEAWLVLASLQAQDQKLTQASESLRKFMDLAQATGDADISQRIVAQAYVLAAQIAEKQGDLKAAEGWLDRIDNASDILSVQRQRASILAKQGRMTEARDLLKGLPSSNAEEQRMKLLAEVQLLKDNGQNEEAFHIQGKALALSPEDNDLIYEQAMLAEKTERLDVMEKLLRQVIARQPDYHHAYNALGYSLAERGVRLNEAKQLIQKALDLAPGDPFITDSLAWAEFRLGNKTEAQQLLQAAFTKKPDPEIAAHLGEVLWSQGETEKAKAIWKEGLRLNPDNQTLKETLKRLGVSF